MSNNSKKSVSFPPDFLWGVSVSHFQVEGNKAEINSRLSDWSRWTSEQGRILDGTNADRACQFNSLYKKDIEIIKELNLNTFRTSLNWAALMPDPENCETLNQEALDYYKDLFTRLKKEGITVFASLFHFCLPHWLANDGGWLNEKTAIQFQNFARLASKELGPLVDYWVTINEPMVYVYHGYTTGQWPPGISNDFLQALKAVKNMLQGHALAYQEIKSTAGNSQIGFSNHWTPFIPETNWNLFDKFVCSNRDSVFNHLFPGCIKEGRFKLPGLLAKQKDLAKLECEIDGLKDASDFLGVNYYTRELSRFEFSQPFSPFGSKSKNPQFPVNDLGWEIYPDGLYSILTDGLRPYSVGKNGEKLPVFVTENGFCRKFDSQMSSGDWSLDDEDRCEYLVSHLMAVHDAIDDGVNMKGYIHWSLMDNFEWAEGLCARFGLCRVDYSSQERTMRKSAKLYSSIASTNSLETN